MTEWFTTPEWVGMALVVTGYCLLIWKFEQVAERMG